MGVVRPPVEWRQSDLPQPPPYTLRNVVRVIGPGADPARALPRLGRLDSRSGRHRPLGTGDTLDLHALRPSPGAAQYGDGPLHPRDRRAHLRGLHARRAGPRVWGPVYALLHLAQVGWPGWALAAASALTAAFLGRMPRPEDRAVIVGLGYAIFLGAVAVTLLGGRARKTVEWAEWLLMAWTLGFLAVLAYLPRAMECLAGRGRGLRRAFPAR